MSAPAPPHTPQQKLARVESRVDRPSRPINRMTNEAVWVQVTIPDDKIEEFLKVLDPAAAWLPVSRVHSSPCLLACTDDSTRHLSVGR